MISVLQTCIRQGKQRDPLLALTASSFQGGGELLALTKGCQQHPLTLPGPAVAAAFAMAAGAGLS